MNNHESKPTDHGKPIYSPDEKAKMGQIMGYLRLVVTDQATLLEAKVRPYDLSKALSECMNKDKAFFEVIEKAMQRYDVMQSPLGEMLLKLMDKANGIECNCPNCKPKREAEKMAKSN